MVRKIAQKVHDAVMLDSAAMLTSACVLDFALDADFEDRFSALQTAARRGATPENFDAALGSGAKLTELVAKYGSNVQFPKTIWDKLEEAEKADPEHNKHVDQQAEAHGAPVGYEYCI